MRKLLALRIVVAVLSLSAWTTTIGIDAQAQSQTAFAPFAKGMILEDIERSEFHSRFTGQDYWIYVSLPNGYRESNRRYPVLYVPDHEGCFEVLKFENELLSSVAPPLLDDIIVVGVPLKVADAQDWRRKRTFDLTPTEDKDQDAATAKQLNAVVHSGGAPLFLRTLKEEVIPFIAARYRTNGDRGLAGYSLGGLFTAYVLLSGDTTFSRYLIGSPSLWWDQERLFKIEDALAASNKTLRGRVFLSVGGDENPNTMVSPIKRFGDAVASRKYPDLKLDTFVFDSTDHPTGVAGALSRGLRILYAKPPKT